MEPPGETHTLEVPEGVDEMYTLFHVTGAYVYVDPHGKAEKIEDVFTKLEVNLNTSMGSTLSLTFIDGKNTFREGGIGRGLCKSVHQVELCGSDLTYLSEYCCKDSLSMRKHRFRKQKLMISFARLRHRYQYKNSLISNAAVEPFLVAIVSCSQALHNYDKVVTIAVPHWVPQITSVVRPYHHQHLLC